MLRQGLRHGGWWPYALALIDAALATLIITLLAVTMLVATQAFDELSVHSGAPDPLPLDHLLNQLAAAPGASQNWWVYVLLVSTMIPSLINLAIAGFTLARGFPGVAKLCLRMMPEGRAVASFNRNLLALLLTLQRAAGVAFALVAQAALIFVPYKLATALVGPDLFHFVHAVVQLNLPALLWHFIFHSP